MTGYYEKQVQIPEEIFAALQRKTHSPAAVFCHTGWYYNRCASRDMLYNLRRSLIETAIEAGLEWFENDLKDLGFLWPNESHYGKAICRQAVGQGRATNSPSFVRAYEKLRGRKPFLFAWDTRNRRRLYMDATFWWKGVHATVSSINDDKGYLNAVVRSNNKNDGRSRTRILRRFQITPSNLREAENESRKLVDEITNKYEQLSEQFKGTEFKRAWEKYYGAKKMQNRIKTTVTPRDSKILQLVLAPARTF